ncbi:UNVERIFIED_CONTAM: putative pentatricopeptide repeat-containing protein [Sesamum radiatum]|uniref:Pentatricopeptide repeat-containing protein n=1 Tax=Sesamum radiatum TaxID=300843 RepID=A0AAW2L1T7_SESRA
MYAKCSRVEDADKVFKYMQERNTVSWNALIAGYAEMGNLQRCMELFLSMEMEGVRVDDATFAPLLTLLYDVELYELTRQLHGKIVKCGLEHENTVINATITAYAECGSIQDAERVFDSADGSLKILLRLATLRLGQQIHILVVKTGLEGNEYVASALIFMYSKCGIIEDAWKSFEASHKDSSVTWNSIIFAYAQHGQGKVALDLFYLMTEGQVKLDHVTFVAALTACSHIGLVEEGRNLLKSMETEIWNSTANGKLCMCNRLAWKSWTSNRGEKN